MLIAQICRFLATMGISEGLAFGVTLFFFTAAVCWIGLLYRYMALGAFSVHRIVLKGLEVRVTVVFIRTAY